MSDSNNVKEDSQTALLTAFLKAVGNKEISNHKIGSDYLAQYFLPFHLRFLLKNRRFRNKSIGKYQARMPGVYEYVMARTAFFDDVFIEALNNGISQIVLLGAGYDTRAYRFAKSNKASKIIELDNAGTQHKKIKCLKKHHIEIPEQVAFGSIDFNKASLGETLESVGYIDQDTTLFTWEGVSMYLEPEAVDAIFSFVASSTQRKNTIVFDYSCMPSAVNVEKYYGINRLVRTIKKSQSDETFKFILQEDKADSYFTQREIRITKNFDQNQLEALYLNMKNDRPMGKPNGMFRIAVGTPS